MVVHYNVKIDIPEEYVDIVKEKFKNFFWSLRYTWNVDIKEVEDNS